MKKAICVILAFVMTISCIAVFADDSVSSAMEEALVAVKSKVTIPENVSVFTPYTNTQDGKTSYDFTWRDENYNVSVDVSCDGEGRISGYSFYDRSLRSDAKLTALSKDEIITFADEFMRKTVPDAFSDDSDCLVYDEDSWSVRGDMYYNISYSRYKNGVKVNYNNANIQINVYNDVPYVRNMYVNFDYDAEFEENTTEITDYTEKYMQNFPIEMVYRDKYSYYKSTDDKDEVNLVYRIKDGNPGYISAVNGEIVTEDEGEATSYDSVSKNTMEAAADMSAGGAYRDILTDTEIKELETVQGLISKEEAESIIKNLPMTGIDGKVELYGYRINEDDGDYYISMNYRNTDDEDYMYVYVRLNAKTGKVLELYSNGVYEDMKFTDAQKKNADRQIDKFLSKAAPGEYKECEETFADYSNSTVSKNYSRMVNGVKYINDGIYVEYDAKLDRIVNYRLDYEDDRVFDNPNAAVSESRAYDAMLSVAPLEKLYVMSGGKHVLCYTLSRYGVEIDALSGEEYKDANYTEEGSYDYSDIDGHWAENQIKKLAEVQIGFNSDKFYPDAPISQADLLRLFAAGVHNKSYLNFDDEDLYDYLINEGVLTKEEKNPQAQVTRENSFVYMVNMDGLGKVAKLYSIFKVEYADGNLLSEGKIGYPAILTGLNVICGDGGYLRPQEPITRAEAATMIYNYMINN